MKIQAHMLLASLVLTATVVNAREGASRTPFVLPVNAQISASSADGRGWKGSGEIPVSFAQARAQFAAKIAAAGWVHIHAIQLGRDRVLEVWSRGDEELTLMTWRVGVGRSGFSYGLSKKASVRRR